MSYTVDDGGLTSIEEYVGVTAPILEQTVSVFEAMNPTELEWCVVESVDVAAWAPLAQSDHLEYLTIQGFSEEVSTSALAATRATSLNQVAQSASLGEGVIYNAYVWSTEAVPVAGFLKSLPSAERAALLGVCEAVMDKPGIPVQSISGATPNLVRAARKVGLVQSAKVISTRGSGDSQTFLFSPILDAQIALSGGTESLHERKLFVAHIMYGHQMASATTGRIGDPIALVNALLRNGQVGPANSIGTDYKLLEAAGIVRVTSSANGRPILEMIKQDVVRDGFGQLKALFAPESSLVFGAAGGAGPAKGFRTPEQDRASLDVGRADMEILEASVMRLREEARRVARGEGGF